MLRRGLAAGRLLDGRAAASLVAAGFMVRGSTFIVTACASRLRWSASLAVANASAVFCGRWSGFGGRGVADGAGGLRGGSSAALGSLRLVFAGARGAELVLEEAEALGAGFIEKARYDVLHAGDAITLGAGFFLDVALVGLVVEAVTEQGDPKRRQDDGQRVAPDEKGEPSHPPTATLAKKTMPNPIAAGKRRTRRRAA